MTTTTTIPMIMTKTNINTNTKKNHLHELIPIDILRLIFSYDSTCKSLFKNCINELKWHDLVKNHIQFDYEFSDSINIPKMSSILPFSTLHKAMVNRMLTILPYLQSIGCKPMTFYKDKCSWYLNHFPHMRRNNRLLNRSTLSQLYWKTTIVVNLLISILNDDMEQWFDEATENESKQQKLQEKSDDDDDDGYETDYTYDSHGRYPIRPIPCSYPRLETTVFESTDCAVYTRYLHEVRCVFKGIKIPIYQL